MSKTIRTTSSIFSIIKYIINGLPRYTVTDELGDILECNYFCRKNNFDQPELLVEKMSKEGVHAYICEGVITFWTREEAEEGIKYFERLLTEKAG